MTEATTGTGSDMLPEMIFSFSDDGGEFPATGGSEGSWGGIGVTDDEHDDDQNACCSREERKAFWENQHKILRETLRRSSSLESTIRRYVKHAREGTMDARSCCHGQTLMEELCGQLQSANFDAAICRTGWMGSATSPSGDHAFLDVVERSGSRIGSVVRVIIDLNFRSAFEMARASDDYRSLVQQLPEASVMREDRVERVVKILCSAAEQCARQRRMHIGPWRKYRCMRARWLGPFQRSTPPIQSQAIKESPDSTDGRRNSVPEKKFRGSMLTVDLNDNGISSSLFSAAVEVL